MNNQRPYDRKGTVDELRQVPQDKIDQAQQQGVYVDPDTYTPYLIIDHIRFDITPEIYE